MRQRAERVFSSQEALRFGWTTTCANLRPLIALGLVGAFLGMLSSALGPSSAEPNLARILRIVVDLLQAALFMTYLRVSLRLVDGHSIDLSRPRVLLADFFTYLLTTLLLSLIVLGGLVLLVVPGIMWGVRFGYAPFLVADGKTDPIDALRESARLTEGARMQLFRFALLIAGINLLGALAFGVGLLVTLPTGLIAAGQVLRSLQLHAGSLFAAPPPGDTNLSSRKLPT